ncbi:hypothetical protein BaRGS_00035662, partial [Batillaria attramentaria]
IPVSSRTALYTIYRIITLPVPFNHTTTHATAISGMPDYLAVTDDTSSYIEMSATDLDLCTGQSIKSCQYLSGERSIQTPTCAVAVFANRTPKPHCSFRVLESAVKSSLLEVQPGVIDNNFGDIMKKDAKLNAELGDIAIKMKRSEKVSRQMSYITMEDIGVAKEDFTTWPHIVAACALAMSCALAVAAVLTFKRLRTLCIVVSLLTGTKAAPVHAPLPSVAPSLQWSKTNDVGIVHPSGGPTRVQLTYGRSPDPAATNPNQTLTCSQSTPGYFLLSVELVSLVLLLLVLLRYAKTVISTKVYRSEVYLEISNGETYIDIFLISLAFCPSEYDLTLPSWIRGLTLQIRSFAPDDLILDWQYFSIRERPTSAYIGFPKVIKLGLLQCRRMRRLVRRPYTVNIKNIHGGRAFYVARAFGSEPVANPTAPPEVVREEFDQVD